MEDYPKLATVLAVLILVFALLTVSTTKTNAQTQEVVFQSVFADVTTPVQSGGLRNIGQVMHLLKVSFPDEVAAITGLEVQFIFSRDGVSWRPTGFDIVDVPVVSNGVGDTEVVAYRAYYGTFRSIAVRNGLATPGAAEMDVDYYGYLTPSMAFVTLTPDRWIFQ